MTSSTSSKPSANTAALIKAMLRARLGRQWRVGDRLPPMKELARQLGQGQTNTHQAVRELAAEGLLESRQRRGTYVLRTPEASLINQRRSQPGQLSGKTISLWVHHETPPGFIRRMIEGFCDVIAPTGAQTVTRIVPSAGEGNWKADSDDALVLFNPGSQNVRSLSCGPHQLVSVISTAARVELECPQPYDKVTVDELHGGSLAGRALRSCGCRRACFLGRGLPPEFERCDQTSALRLYGFESTWGERVDPQYVLLRQGYSPQAGGEMFQRYMKRNAPLPDGIFAASDELASGFIGAAAAHGLTPGRDYQIIGFDGQDLSQPIGEASLTTVKVPAAEMGRRAAQLLIERFADPDRPVHRLQLECVLHHGTTTNIPTKESST